MTNSSINGQPRQTFRVLPSGDHFSIKTHLDKKNGEYIILWKDIQRVHKTACYAKHGTDIVSFLKDDDFQELYPLRIAHHAEIVLELVFDEPDQTIGNISREVAPTPSRRAPASSSGSVSSNRRDLTLVTRRRNRLEVVSQSLDDEARGSVSRYSQLYEEYFQLIKSTQEGQAARIVHEATTIKDAMKEQFGSLKAEMEKNKELQKQLLEMQQQVETKQQEILERLATLQSGMKTGLTQTYQLHEYSIPRLFVVLPKAARRRDVVTKRFVKQFRLYFLCECGPHTVPEGSKAKHETHFADHEGYDVDNPTELFQKLGRYTLKCAQVIKYGFMIGSIVVPALSHFKVGKVIETVREDFDLAKKIIEPLLDETINHIKTETTFKGDDINTTTNAMDLAKVEALEGADLRKLRSYLRLKDKNEVLGNLCRMVTDEGHVKWVCSDHYRESCKELAVQKHPGVVVANQTTLLKKNGKINVAITSSSEATTFNDALVNSRGVRELEVSLEWDATMAHLQEFTEAVTKANIVTLAINGSALKRLPLATLNRGSRFVPIVQTMYSGRTQSLTLKGFPGLFEGVSSSSVLRNSHLRLLCIKSSDIAVESYSIIKTILESCARLFNVELGNFKNCTSMPDLLGDTPFQQNLTTLNLRDRTASVIATYSEKKLQELHLGVESAEVAFDRHLDFLQSGRVTHLRLWRPVEDALEGKLATVLRMSPNVTEIIFDRYHRIEPILKRIISTRHSLLAKGQRCALRQVIFQGINVKNVPTNALDLNFLDTTDASSMSIKLDFIHIKKNNEHELAEVFRSYGGSIRHLVANSTFNDLASELDEVTNSGGSALRVLSLLAEAMTWDCLECVDRIINRSTSLERLDLHFANLEGKLHKDKAVWVLHTREQGKRVRKLSLLGTDVKSWMREFAKTFKTRADFPLMEAFQLAVTGDLTEQCLQWIATMVGPPVSLSAASILPIASRYSQKVPLGSMKPLKELSLNLVHLQPKEWEVVIKAIDFTELKKLDLDRTNFDLEQFKLLVDCMPDDNWTGPCIVPLTLLSVDGCPLTHSTDVNTLRKLVKKFKVKAPSLIVRTLPQLN